MLLAKQPSPAFRQQATRRFWAIYVSSTSRKKRGCHWESSATGMGFLPRLRALCAMPLDTAGRSLRVSLQGHREVPPLSTVAPKGDMPPGDTPAKRFCNEPKVVLAA